MRLAFLVNHVFDGWEPDDIRLGGTEESIVRWSEQLVRWGHEVTIHRNSRNLEKPARIYKGVHYWPRAIAPDADVVVSVKSPDQPGDWIFTNDTDASNQDLSGYKGVIWPSQWAAEHIKVNNPNVKIIPHGYDPTHIYPQAKVPKTVLYASSPDRGLDTLLKVWPEVVTHHPDAQLLVTYGAEPRDVPNTMFLGDVDEDTMNSLYDTSDIWCHPANGGELFGISGVKAQAAGCVPIYFPTMALRETVKSGVRSSPDSLAGDLIRTLGNESLKAAIREELLTYTFPTWESTAKEIEALVVS